VRLRAKSYLWGLLFMAPWVVGLLMFQLGPLVASFILSFTRYDIITPVKWTGVANYVEMFRDQLFSKSLLNTAYYVGVSTPIRIVLAIAMALLLNQGLFATSVFRTVYYLPSVTAGVAISILWRWIYHPKYGALNDVLSWVGITGPQWLADPAWAMPAIIIMGTWLVAGRYMVIFLAGLQAVPEQLYEAARIDGAGRVQQFRFITVPLLSPTIYLVAVLAVIQSFQVFTHAYILTAGGPADSTLVYILYLYRKGFQYFQMGYSCALAWVLFLIIMTITLIQKALSSWVYYEAGD
jgi:multiple sugar transport system permease protein